MGLSHGSAGIAWALLEIAEATGEPRYRRAALSAITRERELLSSQAGDEFHCRRTWCHGPPSLAMARMASAARLDDETCQGEIRAGAESLRRSPLPQDHSLCHGVLGNAEILARAGEHLGEATWREEAHAWALHATVEISRLEHRHYLPLHGRFAGLFCGLAGVGWGLLRFAEWRRTPSILSLDLPAELS